ncbi:MAG: hypothetical protein AAGU12_00510 [Clostridiales bacterium]
MADQAEGWFPSVESLAGKKDRDYERRKADFMEEAGSGCSRGYAIGPGSGPCFDASPGRFSRPSASAGTGSRFSTSLSTSLSTSPDAGFSTSPGGRSFFSGRSISASASTSGTGPDLSASPGADPSPGCVPATGGGYCSISPGTPAKSNITKAMADL